MPFFIPLLIGLLGAGVSTGVSAGIAAANRNRRSSPPPPSPAESRVVSVRIQPVIDYVNSVILSSKSEITQSVVQLSTFQIRASGKGEVVVNGNVDLSVRLDASTTAQTYINETIINRLVTELPPLFANVRVSGPATSQDPELWTRIGVSIREVLRQENYAKIVQSTFDANRLVIDVKGYLEIDEAEVKQDIVTRVVAVNIIQAIIDNTTELSISSGDENDGEGGGEGRMDMVTLVAAGISSISSVLFCILLIVMILSSRKK